MFVVKLLILFQLHLVSLFCQDTLELVITDSVYPSPRDTLSLYDNDDNIYLIGGSHWASHSILKYTISVGNLETIAEFNRSLGNAVLTKAGDIYYVYGLDHTFDTSSPHYKTNDIVKFNLNDINNTTVVKGFYHIQNFSIIMDDPNDNIYIFGGSEDGGNWRFGSILKYSIKNSTLQDYGTLPSPRYATSSVFDPKAGIAYIFGGTLDENLDEIVKFEPCTGNAETLDVKLPYPISDTCSVWDGNNAYIIGGTTDKFSITRFNPSTNNITSFTFDNYASPLRAVGCTFVEKLKRIYIFGGHESKLNPEDTLIHYDNIIMYVELKSLQNTSTLEEHYTETSTLRPSNVIDCDDNEDFTMIPDPHCCNNFYVCYKGQGYANRCTFNLQFSPIQNVCLPEEVVKCGITYN